MTPTDPDLGNTIVLYDCRFYQLSRFHIKLEALKVTCVQCSATKELKVCQRCWRLLLQIDRQRLEGAALLNLHTGFMGSTVTRQQNQPLRRTGERRI